MAMSRMLPKKYLIALVFDWDHDRQCKTIAITQFVIEHCVVEKDGWHWFGSFPGGIMHPQYHPFGQPRVVDWNDPHDMHNVIGVYDRRSLLHLTAMAQHAAEALKAIAAFPPEVWTS